MATPNTVPAHGDQSLTTRRLLTWDDVDPAPTPSQVRRSLVPGYQAPEVKPPVDPWSSLGPAPRAPDDHYGWDWSATTHDALRLSPTGALEALRPNYILPGKGLQGWERSLVAFDVDGYKIGTVYLGGRDDLHVVCTSDAADVGRGAILNRDAEAKTARVDTRVDSLVEFEELARVCEEVAGQYNSKVTVIESRQGGKSLGRTVYVGAPTSAVRVRLYEKWLESPGEYAEGTNRVEVQLRPASRVKQRVSEWTAAETFCASKVTRALASALGDRKAPRATLHVKRGTPDLERTLEVMGHQYGRAVDRWLEVSDGDYERLLAYIAPQDEQPRKWAGEVPERPRSEVVDGVRDLNRAATSVRLALG